MPCPVRDLRAYLLGSWTLQRSVAAADGTALGEFTGAGTFSPDGSDGLHYEEQGTLVLSGHRGPAYRALRYHGFDGPGCAVAFADGRPFHTLDLRTGHWHAEHPCRADRYSGEFTVRSPDLWTQAWLVRGAAKDYRMHTTLSRR